MNKFLMAVFFLAVITVNSQSKKIDTIYGSPKSVKEKVKFLKKGYENYKFLTDNDYGHAMFFLPKNVKNEFEKFWFHMAGCFYINYEKEFLKDGKIKNEEWYNKDGSLKRRYEYTYDSRNNIAQKKEIYLYDDYKVQKHKYSRENKLISILRYYSDRTDEYSLLLINYDSLGRESYYQSFNEEGYKHSMFKKYDSENRLLYRTRHDTSKMTYYENGGSASDYDSLCELYKWDEYKYDNKGNRILKIKYNSETKQIRRKDIYRYDDRNNLIYEGFMRNNNIITSYKEYKFDKKNQKVFYEHKILSDLEHINRIKYSYDNHGYITNTFLEKNQRKHKITYKYKFDKVGNWIQQIKIVDGEPLYVWTRKIKYFK